MTTELQQSANEVLAKKKHDAFARHMANAAEALVDALAQFAQDAAASALEIRERDECIQEQQALLDRCAEVLEHALANVKALTGGDERRMRQLLSALRKEDNARDLLLDENAELRRQIAAWEEKAKEWLLSPEAAKRLDGYRELGEKCAQLEAERDMDRRRLEAVHEEYARLVETYAALKAREGPVGR